MTNIRARELTNKAIEEAQNKYKAKHVKFVNKVLVKIGKEARKGRSRVSAVVPKKLSGCLVTEQLELKGFRVVPSSKNGKQQLRIEW